MSPRILFRTVAVAEALTWAFLLLAMFLKYVTETTEALIPPAGGIHGFVFLVFVVVTIFVWVNQRWSFKIGLLGLVSAIVPLASVVFDQTMERRGKLDGGWRLAPGADTPRGPIEQLQAWVLRKPFLAAAVTVVAVAVVFAALLVIGPPVPSS
ncbi:DUF3817 domain-containing protein [Arthrobacter sp. AET 35A]|uniref:DUF3817 domain-containing protein n=1 Tax=Arthrobacter sp. AET 35A TaxID=2292643 RepID=UPI0017802334|nr:DUF3817 domain-containing protein [Arthrobacter sp. AET 35A]MBE0011290.1 DUF3817 domain-containing protein [Arthrobacter sp. AET 35A]